MDLTSCLAATRNMIDEAWTALVNCNKCFKNHNEEERSELDTDRKTEETVALNGRKHNNKNGSKSETTEISQQQSTISPTQQMPLTQNTTSGINVDDSTINQTNTNTPTIHLIIPNDITNTYSQPNANNPNNTFNPTNTSNPTYINNPTFRNEPVTYFSPENNVDIYLGIEEILKRNFSFKALNDNQEESCSRNVSTKIESIIEWETATVDTVSELADRAVIGGYDDDKSDLWIIRLRYKGEIIPGKLNYKHRESITFIQTDENDADNSIHEFEVCCVAPENIGRIKWVKCCGGDIPKNAVEGGRRASGEKLYIGRCTHREDNIKTLCPGMIQPSHRVLYISYELTVYAAKDYEVMCID